jgi:hypothetical protein
MRIKTKEDRDFDKFPLIYVLPSIAFELRHQELGRKAIQNGKHLYRGIVEWVW